MDVSIMDLLDRLGLRKRYGESAKMLSLDSPLFMESAEKSLAEYQEESMCFLKRIFRKIVL